jgi:hypothetical protein
MARPLRRYYFVFTHPPTARTVKTYATGETPCRAKNAAWDQIERLKHADPGMPQDNQWTLTTQTDEGLVGVR